MPPSQSLSQLLKAPGGLQPLLKRAEILQALTQIVRESLDPVMAAHITLSNLREDTAIISADSPAWLSNIRYLAPTLLQILQQQPGLEKLQKIQFKVKPLSDTETQGQTVRRAVLSDTSAQILGEAAGAIQDPELSAALRRLSAHARENYPKKPQ